MSHLQPLPLFICLHIVFFLFMVLSSYIFLLLFCYLFIYFSLTLSCTFCCWLLLVLRKKKGQMPITQEKRHTLKSHEYCYIWKRTTYCITTVCLSSTDAYFCNCPCPLLDSQKTPLLGVPIPTRYFLSPTDQN